MGNVLDKFCTDNQNTHFIFNNFFENIAFYEIMCKNIVEPGRPHENITRLQIQTDDYVILIPFPLLQFLHLRASMLRHTYIAYLVILAFNLQI